MMTRRHGFSLIELLIVIIIVGIRVHPFLMTTPGEPGKSQSFASYFFEPSPVFFARRCDFLLRRGVEASCLKYRPMPLGSSHYVL